MGVCTHRYIWFTFENIFTLKNPNKQLFQTINGLKQLMSYSKRLHQL